MKAIIRNLILLAMVVVILAGCATGNSTSQSAAPTVSGYISVGASKQIK
jgi:uncharacterized lipoprotein